jgi:hypothetical protein
MTMAATAGAAVATTTMLTVADDDGCRLRKRKGEGAGPTWLLSIINERASNNKMLRESICTNITTKIKKYFVWKAGRLEDYQKGFFVEGVQFLYSSLF